MLDEADSLFAKYVLRKRFCTTGQVAEAIAMQKHGRELGIEENLERILVRKRYLTRAQAREAYRAQGVGEIRLPGYRVVEMIGQGAMGTVYRAVQESLDREVAIKILSAKLTANQNYTERFLREARAVGKLNHPYVVQGIDVGQCGDRYYFVMEYVEGENTLDLLRRVGHLEEPKVIKILGQMVLALEHAHRYGLVHRDIKPDNILLNSRGEAKLCDLGLAKRMGVLKDIEEGVAVGTPHYISPEQAQGKRDVDIRADIYSLGATVYHLLTGRAPFPGEDSREVMLRHLREVAPCPQEMVPEVSYGLCWILRKMMAKEPADRYPTPTRLKEDLELLRQGGAPKAAWGGTFSSSVAPPPGAVSPKLTRTSARRERVRPGTQPLGRSGGTALLAVAGAVTLLFLGAIILVLIEPERKGPPNAAPARSATTSAAAIALPSPSDRHHTAPVPAHKTTAPTRQLEEWPQLLREARVYAEKHPQQLREIVDRFERAAKVADAPHARLTVDREAQEHRQRYHAAVRQALSNLEARVAEMTGGSRCAFGEATKMYTPEQVPENLRSSWSDHYLEQRRRELEDRGWQHYLEQVKGKAAQLEAKKTAEATKLAIVEYREAEQKYGLGRVSAHARGEADRLERQWREAERTAQLDLQKTVDELVICAREKGLTAAVFLWNARHSGGGTRHYRDCLQAVGKDLVRVKQLEDKATQTLLAQIGRGVVSLRAGGKTYISSVVQRPDDESGVMLTSNPHKGTLLSSRDLSPEQVAQWTSLAPEHNPQDRLLLGARSLFLDKPEDALRLLEGILGQADTKDLVAVYWEALEREAAHIYQQMLDAFRHRQYPASSRLRRRLEKFQRTRFYQELKRREPFGPPPPAEKKQ